MNGRGDQQTVTARAMRHGAERGAGARDWWRGAAIYEIYVRSFKDSNGDGIGDLPGILEEIDYVESLNVDGIWLSPFYPSPLKDFGYDVTDHRNVDPAYGTLDDFMALLEAVHSRDMRLLTDFVPAHTSDEHPWFEESRAGRDNPRADWYVWADPSVDGTAPNNWLSSFGGPAWRWEPRRAQYYYHPFLECQPALNLRRKEVVDAILEQMRFWFDLGVDGMRIDAVQCLCCDPDLRSNPPAPSRGTHVNFGGGPNNPFGRQMHMFDRDVAENVDVIERFRNLAEEYRPERLLIGELADIDSSRLSEKYTLRDERLHAVYDFDIVHSPPEAEDLIELLRRRTKYLPSGWLMNVLSNHDTGRAVSNLTRRAVSLGFGDQAARMLMFLQFTLRGGGILYQGDELGLPQPELGREDLKDPWGIHFWPEFEGRDGARTPMPWRAEAPNGGFSNGAEPWLPLPDSHRRRAVDVQDRADDSTLHFTRALLAWRDGEPLVKWGTERFDETSAAPIILYERRDEDRAIRFAINFSAEERWLPLPRDIPVLEVPGGSQERSDHGLRLPPYGFAAIGPEEGKARG